MNEPDEERQRVAAEVLELGQSIFDMALDAASASPPTSDEDREPMPVEELRAAADEFFEALRVLFGISGQT